MKIQVIFAAMLSTAFVSEGHVFAASHCQDNDLETSITIHPASEIYSWKSLQDLGGILKAEHVIPAKYIEQITRELGSPQVRHMTVHPQKESDARVRDVGIGFEISAGGERLMTFQFFPRKDRKATIEVHNLEFTNRMQGQNEGKLAPDQSSKGFGIDVFRFAVEGLMHFVQKGPYQDVMSALPQHYGVYKLYQRFGKFKPIDTESAEFFTMIDSYRLTAKNWPDPYKIDKLDGFISSLGTREQSVGRQDLYYIHLQYVQTGKVPENVTLLKDASGKVVALGKENGPGDSYMQFVNTNSKQPDLVDWSQLEHYALVRSKL